MVYFRRDFTLGSTFFYSCFEKSEITIINQPIRPHHIKFAHIFIKKDREFTVQLLNNPPEDAKLFDF